jgi:hypothetical protein
MAMPAHRSTSQRLHRRSMGLAVSVRLSLARAARGSRWHLTGLADAKPMMCSMPGALPVACALAGRCSGAHLATGDSWKGRPGKLWVSRSFVRRENYGCPLTFPRLSYGNPEPSSKRGNALRRQWNVQPFA